MWLFIIEKIFVQKRQRFQKQDKFRKSLFHIFDPLGLIIQVMTNLKNLISDIRFIKKMILTHFQP